MGIEGAGRIVANIAPQGQHEDEIQENEQVRLRRWPPIYDRNHQEDGKADQKDNDQLGPGAKRSRIHRGWPARNSARGLALATRAISSRTRGV
jgi:hypothetical protein